MNSFKPIRRGDKIHAMGVTYVVDEILYQDYNGDRDQAGGGDCWGYDVEFVDMDGIYHHWKQNQDYGEVIRAGRRVHHDT